MSEKNKKTENGKKEKVRKKKADQDAVELESVASETETSADAVKPKYYKAERAAKYRAYRNAYVHKNVKQIVLRFNMTMEEDVEIYDYLVTQDNITQYIKALIKKEKEKKKKV